MASVWGAAETPARAQDVTLDEHLGFQGVWLRNDVAEAFIGVEPRVRVLAFNRLGEATALAQYDKPWTQGVRTWVMEPVQTAQSSGASRQPGTVVERTPTRVRIAVAADEGSQLRAGLEAWLDADAPVLHLRHRLENLAEQSRRLSVWPIVAVQRDGEGRIVIPYGQGGEPPHAPLIMYTKMPHGVRDPGYVYGRHALIHDLRIPRDAATKLGVHTPEAWVALIRGRQVLLSETPFVPGATYPEGGGNVTTFANDDKGEIRWAEMEHTGPLTDVGPGEATTLDQTMRIFDLPEAPTADADPDALRERIEAAR